MTQSSTNGHSITAQSRPHFAHLLDLCAPLPPLRTAVICPEEETALAGALLAAKENLIEPILVGELAKIQETAVAGNMDISAYEIVDAEGEDGAAHAGVDLVIAGHADGLMKGFIHSDTYLSAVIRKKDGLRTAQRTSHCFVMDVPNWPKPVIITDAALNVAPEVKHKISIAQNAVDLARALEIGEPKVAVLSAVESPNPAIASSIEARAVADAAQDGAVVGGLVDGPFALDNAVSVEAADLKGITSPVAGKADVLLVPSIEAGNILFKALTFMCGSETAGLVVGAKVPVILTSRADSEEARIASCALAVLYDRFLKSAE